MALSFTSRANSMRNHFLRMATRYPLRVELILVVVTKITLLILAGIFLFGDDQRPHINTSTMVQHLFDQDTPQATR